MKSHPLQTPQLGWLNRHEPAQGFILIVTLSMMALLTLLAVGLFTLASVKLRSSQRESDLVVARSNARLGLLVALNQLQETLGPDQRVTAPADLEFPSAASSKWVGVYGNASAADYSQRPSAIPSEPYKPALLNWLVSGNHDVAFSVSTTSGSFGQITSPATGIPFNPTDQVSGLDGTAGSLTISNQRAVLMVGSGSVDNASDSTNYVAAPVVEIRGQTGTDISGGYAYWVGDEGIKARVDLRDNYRQQDSAAEAEAGKAFSFLTAQRNGIEMMRRDGSTTSKMGDDFDPDHPDLEKLTTTGGFPLLFPSLAAPAKTRFHDITAHSKSVIADSYAGGLKQDIGAAIYGGSGPSDSDRLFTPENSSEFGLPTWGHLRSWANLSAPLTNPPPVMPVASVRPYTPTQTKFGPVILVSDLAFGVEKVVGAPNQLRIQIFPALVLWNPYTVGIPATNYEIAFGFRPGTAGHDTMRLQLGNSPNFDDASWDTVGTFSLGAGDAAMSPGNGFFRFLVQGSEIPAGECHIYLADAPGSIYTQGTSRLVRAPDTAPIGYNTRYLTSSTSFNFDPTSFTTPYVRLITDMGSKFGMADGDRLEVVLTTPGTLTNGFNQNTPVYQALLDMNLFQRFASVKSPPTLNTVGLQPLQFARSQIMMESRGGFAADWSRTGAMNRSGRGERNRWLANQNPMAPYIKRTANEADLRGGAFSHGNVFSGENDLNRTMLGMARTDNYQAGIGGDPSPGVDAPLIDILPSSSSLMSLGQLQHAQLDPYGFGTTYTFGNAGANVNIAREKQFKAAQIAPPGASPTAYQDSLYDMSWHLNRALWDRYFISSAPTSLKQSEIDENDPLPNARMEYFKGAGRTPSVGELSPNDPAALTEAAANLMVNGGFNINSTSVDAWRAILTGTNQLNVPPTLANPTYSSEPLNAMMPRFSRDVRTSDGNDENGMTNMWSSSDVRKNVYRGNRELVLFREEGKNSESSADAQERLHEVAGELAEKIVEEIRLRGPFLSLGDFVNRDLVPGDEGIRGTLQAALDKMESNQVNPDGSFSRIGAFVDNSSGNNAIPNWDGEHFMGTPISEKGSSSNSRTATAPKHLTQADVLSTLGPSLSARSDTFTIRSYGEAVDAQGSPTAKAWCEAVVQRVPDYIDPSDEASTPPQDLTQNTNVNLGRRFEIVSFRWLSPGEL